jgi:hypothetical protein
MIPNLMHQMHISSNYVSSVMFREKSWKSKKCCIIKNWKKPNSYNRTCLEMEPNPSNDRVMLQGDGLFF